MHKKYLNQRYSTERLLQMNNKENKEHIISTSMLSKSKSLLDESIAEKRILKSFTIQEYLDFYQLPHMRKDMSREVHDDHGYLPKTMQDVSETLLKTCHYELETLSAPFKTN